MTDWKAIAAAKGIPADDAVTTPLEKLEAQFRALRTEIDLSTEPVTHHVLPLPGAGR
ncbi:MAG: hypothetical protein JNM66_29770 [Bryobacterales bacterium]|nr:hypothetical protein [Bryobacterales bacterium]